MLDAILHPPNTPRLQKKKKKKKSYHHRFWDVMILFDWYQNNVENLSSSRLSECASCEEAMALNKSVLETKPSAKSAIEIKQLLFEINKTLSKKIQPSSHLPNEVQEAHDFIR